MTQKNLLLLCGGGGDEHSISLLSANFFEAQLATLPHFNVLRVELNAKGQYLTQAGELCELTNSKQIRFDDPNKAPWNVDYVIPCIHGYPGETGDIQSYFGLINLPYFGCDSESSSNCFNKVTAKMWFSALGIPNTPYIFLSEFNQQAIEQAEAALVKWGSIFIKAASQGSSVGCYRVDSLVQLASSLEEAFTYSPYVVIEKTITARELEVAAYEVNGEIIATKPGEIICASNTFYSFDEKYAENSQALTVIEADVDEVIAKQIQDYAIKAFKGMKLRHLSRIDFFLTEDNEILLNEINTFPGQTHISMFPKMLQNHGHDFAQYLSGNILAQLKS
ncbi:MULTISPECIES: D-alanine--D-alanine ligase [unclassified Shewanella]|uniref:D-alanine--D-alanine ligase n=1 Tax=unclassified Shewanella TaxID=196818 RepID=UPI001BC5436D|nr:MULTISPECIES: D-alanine--D-alanine ligase [unclassified Shewanella]GIU15958.1 D-alanine--D-alanine ligase [Shewanella sp. MBTL60-112-B1]GIU40546.1 D-alanine--D-alanine ligase [Shewanella sp. MBTL60-112-B2]